MRSLQGKCLFCLEKVARQRIRKRNDIRKRANQPERILCGKEVFFDRSSVKGIDGKLEPLSPVDAELLLKIISLEER